MLMFKTMLQYRYHGREERIPGRLQFLANNFPSSNWFDNYSPDMCLGGYEHKPRESLALCGDINCAAGSAGSVLFSDHHVDSCCCSYFGDQAHTRDPSHHQANSGISFKGPGRREKNLTDDCESSHPTDRAPGGNPVINYQ